MRHGIIAAIAAAGILVLAVPAHGARVGSVGTVAGSQAGLPMAPITITFLMPGGAPDAAIVTFDGTRWRVEPHSAFSREERCRFRADARRLISGRPLTQGVPRWCMSRWARNHLRPDPYPS